MSRHYQHNHYLWIDVARIFAIFLVILNHVNEQINVTPITGKTISIEFLGRLGVPVFLILSGYLMINRDYSNKIMIKKFAKHNLFSIVCSSLFWTAFFSVYSYLVLANGDTDVLIKNLIFQQRSSPQMWYIQILPIVYAFIPLISVAKKTFPRYLNSIVISGATMLSIGSFVSAYTKGSFVPFQWNMSGSWALVFIMLFLMLFGSYLDHISRSKQYTSIIIIIALITLIAFGFLVYKSSKEEIMASLWYDQAQIFVFGSLVVLGIKNITTICEARFFKKEVYTHFFASLGKLTYGVYIVHYIFIFILLKLLPPISGIKSTILITLTTLALSLTSVQLVVKIPKLPKFLFLTK